MVAPTTPPQNGLNAFMRRIYNPIGFSKAYNFILWFIFAGALFGFVLARFMYLDFSGTFCPSTSRGATGAAPGECYYYTNFSQYKIGILLHLGCVLPSGLLAVIQFVPAIRHKWILIHRINGYLVLLLFVLSTVGALMIARHAFGGGLDTQAAVGTLSLGTLASFVVSYVNIKRLQIEQHRAWMLRGWFYAGSIITSRIVMIISAMVISGSNNYYTSRPCAVLSFIHKSEAETLKYYPACASFFKGINPDQEAIVHASMSNSVASEIGAALGVSFGMALWMALVIHAAGIEIYLHLTPREAERLRKVSYQRQLEAGMRNPGSAGLTADRLGDSEPWNRMERKSSSSSSVGSGVAEQGENPKHGESTA